MVIGLIRCTLGRHVVDQATVKARYGRPVGKCSRCRKVLEERSPGAWEVPALRDAGLPGRPR
jgi:hypothetical protein